MNLWRTNMSKPDLGLELRRFRIKARINQQIIAKTLGVSQSQVSRWESGRDAPRAHNADAIEALVWGRPDPQLAALTQFVEISEANLALFNHAHELIAASKPLLAPGGPMQMFGWVLDPHTNPAFAPVFRQYMGLLQNPDGIVGLELKVPFLHEAENWCAHARKTIYPLNGQGVCVTELSFVHDVKKEVTAPEIRRMTPSRRVLKAAGSSHNAQRASSA